jgi:hypothetical protein
MKNILRFQKDCDDSYIEFYLDNDKLVIFSCSEGVGRHNGYLFEFNSSQTQSIIEFINKKEKLIKNI